MLQNRTLSWVSVQHSSWWKGCCGKSSFSGEEEVNALGSLRAAARPQERRVSTSFWLDDGQKSCSWKVNLLPAGAATRQAAFLNVLKKKMCSVLTSNCQNTTQECSSVTRKHARMSHSEHAFRCLQPVSHDMLCPRQV